MGTLASEGCSLCASCIFKARQPRCGVLAVSLQKTVAWILNSGVEMPPLVPGLVFFLMADK